MSINFIAGSSVSGTTIAIPTHQAGDLIIIYTLRDGSTTPPSLPAGWTNAFTGSNNPISVRVGYKFATSSSETSGTWTNANRMSVTVYRNVATPPLGTVVGRSGESSNVVYPAITTSVTNSSSWVIAFGTIDDNETLSAVGGTTLRTSLVAASPSTAIIVSDTNAGVNSWGGGVNNIASSAVYLTYSVELIASFGVTVEPTGVSAAVLLGNSAPVISDIIPVNGVSSQVVLGEITTGGDNFVPVLGVSSLGRVGNLVVVPIEDVYVSGVYSNIYLNYAVANIWTRIITSGTI